MTETKQSVEARPKLRIGVLGSTRGTALEGVLQAAAVHKGEAVFGAEVVLILSNRKDAPILERAARYGVHATFLDPQGLSRPLYDDRVSALLFASAVDLVLMVGYMRIVSPGFVAAWRGRLLNVHPSLLPAFAGLMNLRVHEAVLASGVVETGCTVHQVSEAVDAGEIVLQKRCPVLPGDTPESLRVRVQALESEALVDVVRRWPYLANAEPATADATPAKTEPMTQLESSSPFREFAPAATGRTLHAPARVGLVMGSRSDWPTLQAAAQALDELGVTYEAEVVSAHRTPEKMFTYARDARSRGLRILIAGAGGAAHLPGMIAALTSLPVLGVPVQSKALNGLDSLLSIVQMPGGVPVATFAIGSAGAKNAGLFAAAVLALGDAALTARLDAYRQKQTEAVLADATLDAGGSRP